MPCWPTRTPATSSPSPGTATPACRAAAGLLRRLRGDLRHRRQLGAAHLERVVGAGRRAGPPGRPPEPAHPHLPRPRGGLHHRAERGRACWSCPPSTGASTSRPWPTRSPLDRPGLVGAGGRPRPARWEPGDLPAVEPAPGRPPTAPHPLALLHVGDHRRPQGRPAHRPHVMASALAMAECLDIRADDVSGPGLPLHPHRRDRLADRRPVHRVHAC